MNPNTPPKKVFEASTAKAPKDYMRDTPKQTEAIEAIKASDPVVHAALTEAIKQVQEGRDKIAKSDTLPDVVDVLIQRAREKELNMKLSKVAELTEEGNLPAAETEAGKVVRDLAQRSMGVTTINEEPAGEGKDRWSKNFLTGINKETTHLDTKPEDWNVEPEEITNGPSEKTITKAADYLIEYANNNNLRPEDSPIGLINGRVDDWVRGIFNKDPRGIMPPAFIRQITWDAASAEKVKRAYLIKSREQKPL